jgi:hypothetical protein
MGHASKSSALRPCIRPSEASVAIHKLLLTVNIIAGAGRAHGFALSIDT